MATSVLGQKRGSSNPAWLDTLRSIKELISQSEIEVLIGRTIRGIKQRIRSGAGFGLAWSGGKDSQVLRYVLEQAGYALPAVLGICELEYPAILAWTEQNRPRNLQIINTGQDLAWLREHPKFLFPQNSKISARWFHIVQQSAEDAFLRANKLSGIILGRRKAEGNYIGPKGFYRNSQGLIRYNPLADWKHEDVLAVMVYYKLAFAPYYSWPRGFRVGSGPWAKRRPPKGEGAAYCWKEVLEIDRSIVVEAAEYFPQAAKLL